MGSRARVAALICVFTGVGCTRTLETSPGLHGRVVDEATAGSVGGANVTVMPVEYGSKKPTGGPITKVTAGPEGDFDVPALFDRFWVPALPIDFFGPDATVTVSARGYETAQFDYQDLVQGLWKTNPRPAGFTLQLKREH